MHEAPPAELLFHPHCRLRAAVRELWHTRRLVRVLAEREYRVRYQQTVLGFAWALLTPVLLTVVFTLFLHHVAGVGSGAAPYPLFAYLGLVPWVFFSTSLAQGGPSLITHGALLNTVYCPREVFPLSAVLVAGVDAALSLCVLAALFVAYGYAPHLDTAYWAPVLLAVQVAFTLGLTLLLSAVMVYVRDVKHGLPVLLQVALFATPVAYALDAVPPALRLPYVLVNPLAAVIDGYRSTLLYGEAPDLLLLAAATSSALAVLVMGYTTFKRLEVGMADVA
jgi:ABC-2 type transport system permease protein/lipopolysaccharide transport system permease protein